MSDIKNQSRSNKFEKRRKNTKMLSILMIIASILILALLIIWFFGGNDKDTSSPDNDTLENENIEIEDNPNSNGQEENNIKDSDETENQSDEDSENGIIDEEVEINENENTDVEEDTDVETEQVEPSDDNVIEAYTGNWQPIGTEQEGPHTTIYDDGSDDRIEIKQAVMSVTDLGDDMIEWRIGNGGDQKVIATVSNPEQTDIYRVLLSWIDNQGWQVTKVEKLQEVQY